MPLFRFAALAVLMLLSSTASAQELGDFELDDSLFEKEFLEEGESSYGEDSSWLDPFTAKLSYQTISQINEHENAAPGGSTTEEPYIENNRLSLLIKYQNAFAPGWLLQGNAHAKVYGRRDYEYRANDNNTETEYRVNELFIQRSFDGHSIKFGRQTLVWGEAEGNSVLDVINTTEIRDLSIINVEDARLNQWLLVWDYYVGRSRVNTFVNLYPEFNPTPDPGSPFYIDLGYDLPELDREEVLLEAGVQWHHSVEGSDLALMAAYLYENQLRYDPPPGFAGDASARENDYLLIGFSANRAIDRLLLKADIAYSHNVIADTVTSVPNPLPAAPPLIQFGEVRKDKLGSTVGFEYGIDADQQIMFLVRAERYLNGHRNLAANETLLNDDLFGSYLMRYSYNLKRGDLVLSSTLQRDLNGGFTLASAGLNYTINDNWSAFTQLTATDAETDNPAYFLDDDVRFEFTVSLTF
ncbi:MAG: hypothetical protein WDZ30_10400 [Cellvibrionaceae bacterium]